MVCRAPSVEAYGAESRNCLAPGPHSIRPSRPRQAAGGLLPVCEQLSSCRVFGFFFLHNLKQWRPPLAKKKKIRWNGLDKYHDWKLDFEIRPRREIGMVERRFALSEASSVCDCDQKPLRGREVSPPSQFPIFVWCSETSFFLNNRVLRLPAIVLLNTTFRPGNSGLLRVYVQAF